MAYLMILQLKKEVYTEAAGATSTFGIIGGRGAKYYLVIVWDMG